MIIIGKVIYTSLRNLTYFDQFTFLNFQPPFQLIGKSLYLSIFIFLRNNSVPKMEFWVYCQHIYAIYCNSCVRQRFHDSSGNCRVQDLAHYRLSLKYYFIRGPSTQGTLRNGSFCCFLLAITFTYQLEVKIII